MKKILALAFVAMMSIGAMAQTAQQVLDKTAAVIGNKGGASANFKMRQERFRGLQRRNSEDGEP